MSETPNPPVAATPPLPAKSVSVPVARKVTLIEYLRGAPASVSTVVSLGLKGAVPAPTEADFHEMMVLLRGHGGPVQRLGAALLELRDEQSGFARFITRLAETYALELCPGVARPASIRAGITVADLRGVLRALLFAPGQPEIRARNQPAAFLVLWVSRLRGLVTGDAFAELVHFAFPPPAPKKSKSGVPTQLDLGGILSPILTKKPVRDAVLATVEFYSGRMEKAAEDLRIVTSQVEELRRQVAERERLAEELEARLQAKDAEAAATDQKMAELTRDIADHRLLAKQATKTLRARLNGKLQGELLPLVRDIQDAASMEPVRTHVILDRTDTARRLIEKEAQWLESSD